MPGGRLPRSTGGRVLTPKHTKGVRKLNDAPWRLP